MTCTLLNENFLSADKEIRNFFAFGVCPTVWVQPVGRAFRLRPTLWACKLRPTVSWSHLR